MIGSVRGVVLERDLAGTVLIEVGGIGYVVHVTPRTLAELEPSTTAFLYTHHHVREENQQLFGFIGRDERITFHQLIGTQGIGPVVAMAMIATYTPAALVDIVASADVGALSLVPGIGKRTAEKLLVLLKSRLNVPILDGVIGAVGGGRGSAVGDVREALASLGYGEAEIRDTLRELPDEADASSLLREALKSLGARRA